MPVPDPVLSGRLPGEVGAGRAAARRLVVATGVVALAQGVAAAALGHPGGSAAVLGFVLESGLKVVSWSVVLWSLVGEPHPDRDRRALRALSAAFAVTGVAVLALAAHELQAGVGTAPVEQSEQLIAAAGSGLLIVLAMSKWNLAERLGSRPLHADAFKTGLYATQSVAVFVDLSLQRVGFSTRIDVTTAALVGVLALIEAARDRRDAAG